MRVTRRTLLGGTSAVLISGVGPALGQGRPAATRATAVPLKYVKLRPSIFADAFTANRRYLEILDPERLLHNFYVSAGLPAPKPEYGGWESRGIAGHSLGHWLTAVSLVVANTGDPILSKRLDHALREMARIQAAHGDGYCGGTTVERDGRTVDGKIVFEEVRQGDIRSQGFDLNGGWVPLYTWHKVQAGLIDAHQLTGNPRALPVALALAGYLAGVLEPLSDAQVQQVLRAEHGGLNESYANLYGITGNPRWLAMAERIRHKAVLDPLVRREDKLPGLHANTQIPKVIGLARLHDLTGKPQHATAARFFHETVTKHHTYVIGGNSEREHFGPPGKISERITEATCEACNSYNMMKLTRHLYSWQPSADWWDFYERVQLNHILAHQRPDTGQFVYFMPLSAGARRSYSTPEESFWCCVGSGMESHAKHADSIYWQGEDALFVNLFIPSTLDLPGQGLALELSTTLPHEGEARIKIRRAPRGVQAIAIRIPGWTSNPAISVNGRAVQSVVRDGYAYLTRRWNAGDRVDLHFPMQVTAEPTPDNPNVVAFTRGPLVLAADLGPASRPFEGLGPPLISAGQPEQSLRPSSKPQTYSATSALGEQILLKPFFDQYDRRTAVYFPLFTPAAWATNKDEYVRAQAQQRQLARRTVDIVYLGEMQPERDHDFRASRSETVQLHGRSARKIRAPDNLSISLKRPSGSASLRVGYWGEDRNKNFVISVDGVVLATERRIGPAQPSFVFAEYPLPPARNNPASEAIVTFTAQEGDIDIYEVRMLTE